MEMAWYRGLQILALFANTVIGRITMLVYYIADIGIYHIAYHFVNLQSSVRSMVHR